MRVSVFAPPALHPLEGIAAFLAKRVTGRLARQLRDGR
jgi:hypothetical protein